jgi:hypothetical protein
VDEARWQELLEDLGRAGERLTVDLRTALDDALAALGQTGRAWQEPPAGLRRRAGLGRLEQLYRVEAAHSLEQPLAEWRRRRPAQSALEAFQNYDDAVDDLTAKLPLAEGVNFAQVRSRLGAGASLPWRWWPALLHLPGASDAMTIPVRELALRHCRESVAARSRLDGELQLILAEAALLVPDAWESDRRRALSELAGIEPPDRERERVRWASNVARLNDRASALLAAYSTWSLRVVPAFLRSVFSGQVSPGPLSRRDRRSELVDYWARQQRAAMAFMDLDTAAAALGLQACGESARSLQDLTAEHDHLGTELAAMTAWLSSPDRGEMPAPHTGLRSAEERADGWLTGFLDQVRTALPAQIELADPRSPLPPRLRTPWRLLNPWAMFQASLAGSARPEALEGFRAAESAHREIVREVERAREVVAFGEEARAGGDAEGSAIAREAEANALQLLSHLQSAFAEVGSAAERGLVRAQAASFLDFHIAVDEGRFGFWRHLTHRRGIRASRAGMQWTRVRGPAALRRLRQRTRDAFQWLLQSIGWSAPARRRVDPVVERVDLDRLLDRAGKSTALPRLYRRLFRHEPVEDPRFLIGRERELAGFAHALDSFRQGRRTAVILVGARGSGKTSLINCAFAGANPGEIVRSQFSERLTTAAQMRGFLAGLLGVPPGANLRQWLADHRRILVLEELERAFLAEIGGFDALRELISLVETGNAATNMWVFSINESAFAYLDAVTGLSRSFPMRINAMTVSAGDLRRAILYRHHLSGLRLQFPSAGRAGAAGTVRRELGIEDDPRDVFFETLHDQSEGVFRSALHLWEDSIERIDGGVVCMRQPGRPEFERLMANLDLLDSFALLAILRHGGLTPGEVARVLGNAGADWQARCERLIAMGLIEPDLAHGGLRVASLAARAVRETLRRRNLE